jgi:hypothetical protein
MSRHAWIYSGFDQLPPVCATCNRIEMTTAVGRSSYHGIDRVPVLETNLGRESLTKNALRSETDLSCGGVRIDASAVE